MLGTRADSPSAQPSSFALGAAVQFFRANTGAVLLLSLLLLLPCHWQTQIQAGDRGSHVCNAWLAQLVERHEISGVIAVRQWNNVLFDLLLLDVAKALGFVAAEKIVVSLGVLLFFWGAFAL